MSTQVDKLFKRLNETGGKISVTLAPGAKPTAEQVAEQLNKFFDEMEKGTLEVVYDD